MAELGESERTRIPAVVVVVVGGDGAFMPAEADPNGGAKGNGIRL